MGLSAAQALDLAKQHHGAGRLADAERLYRQVLDQQPDHAHALYLLGHLAFQQRRFDDAAGLMGRAVQLRPGVAEYFRDLGKVLAAAGRTSEAIDAYRQAIALQPALDDVHNLLGNALQDDGNYEAAIIAYRQGLALWPDDVELHNNIGNALQNLGRLPEAVSAYERSLRLRPDYAEAHNNRGCALKDMGEWERAIEGFRRAVELRPDFPAAHWNLANALLSTGNLREGWREYEWRTHFATVGPRQFDRPPWKGEAPDGRRVLLHAEQGFGDTIQFARYVRLVAERGARVVVECQPALRRLLQSLDGAECVIAQGEALPDFDLHCPLLSLPLIFATGLNDIPSSVPYLHADPADVARWKVRLDDDRAAMKIGLVWAGLPSHVNDRNRSLTLANFAGLGSLTDTTFYSLQVGDAAAAAQSPPAGLVVRDFTTELRDFADTAALIANLDLVISVDTAVAHLAGAIGKAVWVLLPTPVDFRWMLGRADSPWYPTMRLFRQQSAGDWAFPIQAVKGNLAAIGRVPGRG